LPSWLHPRSRLGGKGNEAVDESDDDEEEEEVPALCNGNRSFFYLLRAADKPGDKIPMYTTYNSTLLESTRFNLDCSSTMKNHSEECGYRPKQKGKNFGGVGTRKFFRQNARNTSNLGVDQDSHLNQSLSHTSATGLLHYENPNEYRVSYPANIFQNHVDAESAKCLIEGVHLTPAFSVPNFFKPNWPPLLDPLPDAVTFMTTQRFSPIVNCVCPVVGCSETRYYAGDLATHINQTHPKTRGDGDTVFKCQCGKEYGSWKSYQCHLTVKKNPCNYRHLNGLYGPKRFLKPKPLPPPPGQAYFLCTKCPHNYFLTLHSTKKHMAMHKDGDDAQISDDIVGTSSYEHIIAGVARDEDESLDIVDLSETRLFDNPTSSSVAQMVERTSKNAATTVVRAAKGAGKAVKRAAKGAGQAIKSAANKLTTRQAPGGLVEFPITIGGAVDDSDLDIGDIYNSALLASLSPPAHDQTEIMMPPSVHSLGRPQSDIGINPNLFDDRGTGRRRQNEIMVSQTDVHTDAIFFYDGGSLGHHRRNTGEAEVLMDEEDNSIELHEV
jgi:hypothetical protein